MIPEGQLVPANSCYASVCNISATSSESSFPYHISDPKPIYTTSLAIECKRRQTEIPQNIILGYLRPMQEEDTQVLEDAAEDTATVLAESWMSWSSGQQVLPSSSTIQHSSSISSTQTWKVSEQQKELATAGLHSSVLSPFTESTMICTRDLHVPDGKRVFVRLPPPSSTPKGVATRFLRKYDGRFLVVGHNHDHEDLLRLRHLTTGKELKTVNIEKIVVAPVGDPHDDIRPLIEEEKIPQNAPPSVQPPNVLSDQAMHNAISSELAKVAFAFGQYLSTLPKSQCYASEACKFVYQNLQDARDILSRHGKLKGLVAKCPYLSLNGGPHGGTYLLTLELFQELSK